MAQPGFIFGGNTGMSYDQIQKQRDIANELLRANMSTPQNVGEGLSAIGRALAAKAIDKRTSRADDANRAASEERRASAIGSIFGGSASPAPYAAQPPVVFDPASPQGVASDAMAALGKTVFTPGDRDSFVSAMMPHALRVSQMTGLDPRLVIAQSAQETGWGKSAPNNNFFGIKSHGKGGAELGTFEFVDGQRVNMNDSFRTYGGMGESAEDYARFLMENPRYKEMLAAGDLEGQLAALGRSGYATDPNYSTSVGSIANSIQIPGMAPAGAPATPAPTGGVDPANIKLIADLLADPYTPPGEKVMLEQAMAMALQGMDPMRQMEMERTRLELDQMRNPQPEFTQLSPQEVAQLGLPPGVYQRGPDGRIDTVEKTQGVVDPIAELRARATAAGLQEGTPEFQAFMLSGGKQQDGMVIESDGQGGFRMVQGAGASGAAAKPFTEGQSKDVVYATRAKGALEALDPIANALTDRGAVAAGWLPFGLGGGMQDDNYQVAKTAGDEFLQAILRKDTGAAITADEQALYGETYLPRPGDNEARLAYKAQARQRAVAAIEAGMSPAQIIAQEKALSEGAPPPPDQEAAAAVAADPAGFQAFSADPSAIAAAQKYGVTLEEMWAIKQDQE